MRRKLCMIILGIAGRTPVAGVGWQVLHYLEGLRRLGHEVYYVEDTQAWPYNPETGAEDCLYIVKYLGQWMSWCGMADRWAYCDVSQQGRVHGLSESQLARVYERADGLINLTGSTPLREKHLRVPVRVYMETDPGVPQIEIAQGREYTINLLRNHTHHFSFAENLGKPGCLLPVGPFKYHTTRQPVVLDWWQPDQWGDANGDAGGAPAVFTTITNWKQSNSITWNGETYTWTKDQQFLKFIDLPEQSGQTFELALACQEMGVIGLLRSHEWRILDAQPLTSDILPYRDYIARSRGEFTVAKDQYVRLRTGWFSDRSACYLAAGRPVITQDTGFGRILPTGAGLFSFSSMDEVLTALEHINSDYARHCRAAHAIAEEFFKAETVMAKFVDDLGL
jgi:hypothetical protein